MRRRNDPGAPWSPVVPNKRSAGSPALNPLTLAQQGKARYLDANAAANDIRKASAMPSFVGLELSPLPPLEG